MKKLIALLLVVLVAVSLVALAGCGSGKEEPGPGDKEKTTQDEVTILDPLEGENVFDFAVFTTAAEEDSVEGEYGNVFISPESLRIALMMAYNGADGETKTQMAELLGVQGMSLEEANGRSAGLLESLEGASEETLVEIADSLWSKEGILFFEDYIERCEAYFDAEVFEITDADAINQWVSEKTNGKIDEIVDEVNPMTLLFLINAIYFRGDWSEPFDETNTEDRDFTLQDGSLKEVPLMHQSGEYDYFEDDELQAIELHYGEEKKLSMYVFLPQETTDLQAFVENLSSEIFDEWMTAFEKRKGDIYLPRFELEYSKELVSTLEALGMVDAFDPEGADFSQMVSEESLDGENAYFSSVLQKTYVDVNEEGTEAAAVTKMEMEATASVEPEPEERFEMVVDHPFFFVIRDNETGTLMFMGLIVDPQ